MMKVVLKIDPSFLPLMDAKTALPDVGDRRIDLECLADRLAGLTVQVVFLEAAKSDP